MSRRVSLNHAGIARLLDSDEVRKMVNDAAEKVAAQVRRQSIEVGDQDGGKHERPLPVRVNEQTTDRARAQVVLAHPSGLAVQAKHGALTKAAAAEGLEVRSD